MLIPRKHLTEIMNEYLDTNESLLFFDGNRLNSFNQIESEWKHKDGSICNVDNVNKTIIPSLLPPSTTYYHLPNCSTPTTVPSMTAQFNKNSFISMIHGDKMIPFNSYN